MDDLKNLPWIAQFLIFLALGIVLIIAFYMMSYKDAQRKIKGINVKIEAVNVEIDRAELKKDKLPQIRQEKKEKELLLEQLKAILPEKKEISQILKRIESLVAGTKLRTNKFASEKQKPKDYYIEHPYRMDVDGSYHNLGVFFDQLSRLTKIFTVDGLTISPLGNMTPEFTIKARFVASTFTEKEYVPPKSSKKNKRRRR